MKIKYKINYFFPVKHKVQSLQQKFTLIVDTIKIFEQLPDKMTSENTKKKL